MSMECIIVEEYMNWCLSYKLEKTYYCIDTENRMNI